MAWRFVGAVFVIGGFALVMHGVSALDEPARSTNHPMYGHFMSRQVADIFGGGIFAMLGIAAYLRGRR